MAAGLFCYIFSSFWSRELTYTGLFCAVFFILGQVQFFEALQGLSRPKIWIGTNSNIARVIFRKIIMAFAQNGPENE